MVLSEGRRLGPCEIQASIGAGGMGEVCKALDTRLDRTVAIRVLPDHVGAEANLRHRLEREAKAISRLSQPTIRTRHDIGTQDGTPFLVMEYLDGEALSERIGREPLPLAEAVQHDLALLGTLEARHGQSLVHRDLKPSNIFLAANGLKLLLDRDTVCDQHPPSALPGPARPRRVAVEGVKMGSAYESNASDDG